MVSHGFNTIGNSNKITNNSDIFERKRSGRPHFGNGRPFKEFNKVFKIFITIHTSLPPPVIV